MSKQTQICQENLIQDLLHSWVGKMWALFPTILFLCSMHYSWGYRIDSSCQADNKIQQIKNAATEAINIAANAIARTDFGNNPGTMMMDLFGDNSQQMYQSAKSESCLQASQRFLVCDKPESLRDGLRISAGFEPASLCRRLLRISTALGLDC